MKKKRNAENSPKLKSHTKHSIIAVVFFVLALFFLMSAFNLAGVTGKFFYEKLHYLLGIGYILLPVLFILLGSSFLKSETPEVGWARTLSGIMFLLSSLGMIDISSAKHAGGLLGEVLAIPFVHLFDVYASLAFLGAILIISILVMFDAKLELASFFKNIWALLVNFLAKSKKGLDAKVEAINKNVEEEETQPPESPLSGGQNQRENPTGIIFLTTLG